MVCPRLIKYHIMWGQSRNREVLPPEMSRKCRWGPHYYFHDFSHIFSALICLYSGIPMIFLVSAFSHFPHLTYQCYLSVSLGSSENNFDDFIIQFSKRQLPLKMLIIRYLSCRPPLKTYLVPIYWLRLAKSSAVLNINPSHPIY